MTLLAAAPAQVLASSAAGVVSQKERKCVTWQRLNELDFGLKEIGRLATRTSYEIGLCQLAQIDRI